MLSTMSILAIFSTERLIQLPGVRWSGSTGRTIKMPVQLHSALQEAYHTCRKHTFSLAQACAHTAASHSFPWSVVTRQKFPFWDELCSPTDFILFFFLCLAQASHLGGVNPQDQALYKATEASRVESLLSATEPVDLSKNEFPAAFTKVGGCLVNSSPLNLHLTNKTDIISVS